VKVSHLILGLFLILNCQLFGQVSGTSPIDSTTYHYYKITKATNPVDLPEGIVYFEDLYERHLAIGDTLAAIDDLRLVAMAQFQLGDVYGSEQSAVRALSLVEAHSQSDTLAEKRLALYNQLGNTYRATQNYQSALERYEEAYLRARSARERVAILNNMGTVYKDLKQYENAKKVLTKAQSLFGEAVPSATKALILDNLGYVLFQLDEAGAKEYLDQALRMRKEIGLPAAQFASHSNLFELFLNQDRERALAHADTAYGLAQKLDSGSYLEEALSLYVLADESPRVKQYKAMADSLARQRQQATNKHAFLKYNVAKEQLRTQEAQLQGERQKRQKLLLVGILLGVVIVGMAFFLLIRLRHKKVTQQQVFATEADISKKLHDEVANDLYRIMVQWQQPSPDGLPPIEALDAVYQKTRNLSRDLGDVPTEDFHLVLGSLLDSYRSATTKVLTRNLQQIDWRALGDLQKKTIYRVLQELMTNMRKHSNARLVVLSFSQQGKKLRVEYSDNGIGTTLARKNGLQNAENRMEAIGGRITFESGPGTGFKATLIL
jgi:signal transduction histidine kinase